MKKELWKKIALGSFLSLAWATSLRSWMQGLALHFGDEPELSWNGTYLLILIPGAVTGALLAIGDYFRQRRGNPKWQWAGFAPLLMVLVPFLGTPNFISILRETGNGGGAIGVTVLGMIGGFALSGRGPIFTRILAGIIAGGLSIFFGYAIYSPNLALIKYYPLQVFGILHFLLLMSILMWAASLPYRKIDFGEFE